MESNITVDVEGIRHTVFFYKDNDGDTYSVVVDKDAAFDFWEDEPGTWTFTETNEREENFRRQIVYAIISHPSFDAI
jgi:hypothetical protein